MTRLGSQFNHGDRIRYATTGDDGFPLVRYGFVGGQTHDNGPVVVMLDGELGGDVVDLDQIEPVHISNVTLRLTGIDLLANEQLRLGLVSLWRAEADEAGLQIGSIKALENGGEAANTSCYTLARVQAASKFYLLRATMFPSGADEILLHCDLPDHS
ncbi:MAG: hypothetical protein ACJAR2_004108 [Ilumatobacter sp.]|jgi:hypothetical protein